MTGGIKREKRPGREWLRRMAEAEDQCKSVSVGGLAADVGMFDEATSTEALRVFSRLIEFERRSRGLSVEDLAKQADVDLAELIAIENTGKVPRPRTVFQLAKVLQLATGKLMELAGLAERKDQSLTQAALRFAARSEPRAKLTKDEKEALEEFVKVLVETSDGS